MAVQLTYLPGDIKYDISDFSLYISKSPSLQRVKGKV